MKLYSISLLLLICVSSFGNVKPDKSIIRQLCFEGDAWELIINPANSFSEEWPVDSILIKTNSGKAKVKSSVIAIYNQKIWDFTINADSLETPLSINKQNDRLEVVLYGKAAGNSFLDFGPEDWNHVRAVKENECIRAQDDFYGTYSICNGENCKATITGKLYDKEGNIIANLTTNDYNLFLAKLKTDENGNFSFHLYSGCYYNDHSIVAFTNQKNETYIDIRPLDIVPSPGEEIELDIHLLQDITAIESNPEYTSQFFCLPNPVETEARFVYSVPSAVDFENGVMTIYSSNGAVMDNISITEREGELSLLLDGKYTKGAYYYTVTNNTKVLYKGQFFVK